MNIQSLSIVVPTKGKCWNNCPFCVSKQHNEDYGEDLDFSYDFPEFYINKLKYVLSKGCDNLIFTGVTEPQQNLTFIHDLLGINMDLINSFFNIAIQTTGSGLDENDIEDLAANGLTTLALSVNSFNNNRNWEITHTPPKFQTIELEGLYRAAKKCHLNVRLCVNLTSEFNDYSARDIFEYACRNDIDQLTFRKIYAEGDSKQAQWIRNHEFAQENFAAIQRYVIDNGTPILRLPYGFTQYDVHGVSTVIDDNCMAKDNISDIKYLILRPNGHLYTRWDMRGSLVF